MTKDGLVDVEWAGVGNHLDADVGVHLGYELNPLVLSRDGVREASLIAHRVHGNVVGAISLFDWLQIGVDVPVTLFQTRDVEALGSAISGVTDPSFIGTGDLRLMPKIRLLREKDQFVNLAVSPTVTIPTGFPPDSYFGEGFFTFQPEVMASRTLGPVRLAANLGYRLRPETRFFDLVVGNELFFRGGAGLRLQEIAKIPLEIQATYSAATNPSAFPAPGEPLNTIPSEALLGANVDIWGPLSLFGYAGVGLIGGFGTPDARGGLGLRWAMRAPQDADNDGIEDDRDRCPNDPEDKDGFEDGDGCPDRDNDNDGIKDGDDRCPDDAEDMDGFEDGDGCPDLDNDNDGIKDSDDSCPNEPGTASYLGCPVPDTDGDGIKDDVDACPKVKGIPEKGGCPEDDRDHDGIADAIDVCPDVAGHVTAAGCPDRDGDGVVDDKDRCPDIAGLVDMQGCKDSDQDGIADPDDKCPNEPETINGFEDSDGCPDKGKVLVVVTKDKIELKETVFFDSGKDTIQKRSFSLIDQIAQVMKAHPEVKRVRIEGHTDSDGPDDKNLDLSKRRAKAVLNALVARGVEAKRLESEGFGETRPIAPNATKAGKAQNRRVELAIVE
jgi:outer membrane protein OmpA-like peptidoglycan-associated protein